MQNKFMEKRKLSLIIPCFNEEKVVNETYKRVKSVLSTIDCHSEIIFINDGSSDNTYFLLQQLAEKDKSVKVIGFSRNFGHQQSITAGINHCTGDIAAILDADLQDPPEVIPEMLKIMDEEKANVVYGVRTKREGEGFLKKITAKWFYRFLNKMSDVAIPNDTGDFRIIDRKIIENFNKLKEKNKYIRGLVSWLGFKQVPCYYEREKRFAGDTKYSLAKMLNFSMIALFYFSKKVLKIPFITAFFLFLIAIIYSLILIFYTSYNPSCNAVMWHVTLIILFLLASIQLFVVGIVGKYIQNLFDEINHRPEYIIDEKINFE
jgi:dolichol-phosphate mannosyltransferase